MEVLRLLVTIAVCISYCHFGQCVIPLIPVAIGVTGLGGLTGYFSICRFKECCTDDYIPADFHLLSNLLKANVYGQHLVHDTVLHAVKSHVSGKEPKKALAMSFHGPGGTGKNYVAEFVVQALYKKGADSNYVHNYKGRLDFRHDGLVENYKAKLQEDIKKHLKACPRSIFIFDEVHKIPKGVLDVLVPFLDYHPKIRGVDPAKAIFIFLSNTGSTQIVDHMFEMWNDGTTRNQVKLEDFEHLVAVAAFNEKGGFHKSDAIESSVIDHYIPFLPLERDHVRRCTIDSFRRRGVEPENAQIEKVIEYLPFGPSPHNIYSTGGCKRLDAKVGHMVSRDIFKDEL